MKIIFVPVWSFKVQNLQFSREEKPSWLCAIYRNIIYREERQRAFKYPFFFSPDPLLFSAFPLLRAACISSDASLQFLSLYIIRFFPFSFFILSLSGSLFPIAPVSGIWNIYFIPTVLIGHFGMDSNPIKLCRNAVVKALILTTFKQQASI